MRRRSVKRTILLHPTADWIVREVWSLMIRSGYPHVNYSTAVNAMIIGTALAYTARNEIDISARTAIDRTKLIVLHGERANGALRERWTQLMRQIGTER